MMTNIFHDALTYIQGNNHAEQVTPERFQLLYDFLKPYLLEAKNLPYLFNRTLDQWCLYESLEEAEYDYEYGFISDPIINPDGSIWVYEDTFSTTLYRKG